MGNRFIRGSFSKADSEYEIIGNVLSELQEMGYALQGISTAGETSGHDWTYGFKKKYSSFCDFTEHAVKDFMIEYTKNKHGPSPDWDSTSFDLSLSFRIHLFTLNAGGTPPAPYKSGWCIIVSDSIPDSDELLQKTLAVLQRYEQNSSPSLPDC